MLRSVDTPQFVLYMTRSIRPTPISLPRLRADGDLVHHSPPVRSQDLSEWTWPPPFRSMADSFGQNYYELLNVPQTASLAETKAPYHLLLFLHPDKSGASKDHPTRMDVHIGLKDAFITLFSSESRTKYDSKLSSHPDPLLSWGQLVHIVSLKDFEDLGGIWTYQRRCGG